MARPREAMASALRRIPDFQRINRAALAGHARLFVHPGYARLVNTEPYVKRLIPLLIILFVVAVGTMRGVALYQAHEQVALNAEQNLSLFTTAISSNISESAAGLSLAEPSETLQGQLENALPPYASERGRLVLLLDPEGRVVATAPRQAGMAGSYVEEIVEGSEPILTLGERAGVLTLALRSGEDVMAAVNHNAEGVGSVAVLQPTSGVFAEWRQAVSRETTVFVATSIVLVILGFAFHAQAARAQEAELDLFGDAGPLPYGAPPRAFRTLGVGPVARRDLLVAVDVRDSRP